MGAANPILPRVEPASTALPFVLWFDLHNRKESPMRKDSTSNAARKAIAATNNGEAPRIDEELTGETAEPQPAVQLSPLGKFSDSEPEPELPEPTDSLPWRPFPTNRLPEPLRSFVDETSQSIGCDASFVALPALACCAAAIGSSRRVVLKRGWSAPPTLWTACIGASGTGKSPAWKAATAPTRKLQEKAFKEHNEKEKEYQDRMQEYKREISHWKAHRDKGPPPVEPSAPPEPSRLIISDTTVEAVAPILLANPRGLLLSCDELSGWIASFDRYAANGRGARDAASWLPMYSGECVLIDRKTGDMRTIFVPAAHVSICGGIQPDVLRKVLGALHLQNGLAARVLMAYPPRQPRRWSEAEINPETATAFSDLLAGLYNLAVDEDGARPQFVGLLRSAKALWIEYFNDHGREQAGLTGPLASAFSKLEEVAPRLALIFQLVREVAGDPAVERPGAVDARSMEDAIALTEWLKHESRRVYKMLASDDADRERDELVAWIRSRGSTVNVRDVQRGVRRLRRRGDAEEALDRLVRDGLGVWLHAERGSRGRPPQRFQLTAVDENPAAVDENPKNPEILIFSSTVDTVDAVDADGWGEVS